MNATQHTLDFQTKGRGLYNVTGIIDQFILQSNISIGLCNVFLHHTSASLIICENADPQVQKDLESFMQRLVPDGDKLFQHTEEGIDDMPSHIRSILTSNSLSIPISKGRLQLGTWQGIFIWEHRFDAHMRKMTITAL